MRVVSINKPTGIIDGSIMLKTLNYSYNHIVSFFGEPVILELKDLSFIEWHIEFEDGLRASIISYFKEEIDKERENGWMISADKQQSIIYRRLKRILESKDWGAFNYIRNKIFKKEIEENNDSEFCDSCECNPCDCDWGN